MSERKENPWILLPLLFCLGGMLLLGCFWQGRYEKASYVQVSRFYQTIRNNNPEMEADLLFSLKEYLSLSAEEQSDTGYQEDFLEKYGYSKEDFGHEQEAGVIFLQGGVMAGILAGFLFSVRHEAGRKRRRIGELTVCLEKANEGENIPLILEEEDEFSSLQDEIHKTVGHLYTMRENAEKARENFRENLINIAHQIKTPLTAALLTLQIMEKKEPGRYTEAIGRQLRRLNRLEEELMLLSTIDSGTLTLRRESVDVYTVLELAAENLAEFAGDRGIQIQVPDRGRAEFTGDMEWTMEAIMNLLKNSMEHSPEGSRILCDYSSNFLYTEIRILDEGEGFLPEDIPHLFERFYRGKNKRDQGLGIGLSLAGSLLEMQNGVISAGNRPEGGAYFEIRFYRTDSAGA